MITDRFSQEPHHSGEPSAEVKHHAALTTAESSMTPSELRMFLQMLGLERSEDSAPIPH